MKGKEIEATLKLVSLTLHLCNVVFKPCAVNDAEGSTVDMKSLNKVACLMSNDPKDQEKLSQVKTTQSILTCSICSDKWTVLTLAYPVSLSFQLLAHAFCYRQLETKAAGGKVEKYEVPLNPSQASSSRDALIKLIYSRLFDNLVIRVNKALASASPSGASGGGGDLNSGESIGVLDIYGKTLFKNHRKLCVC